MEIAGESPGVYHGLRRDSWGLVGDFARDVKSCIMRDWRTIPTRFNSQRVDVRPFAGVYPTRWKIDAEYALERNAQRFNRRLHYLGKPNPITAAQVLSILQHATIGVVRAWEFDRGGTLAWAETYAPRIGGLFAADYNFPFRFYYPWIAGNGFLVTTWTGRTMHRHPLLYQKRRMLVYDTRAAIPNEDWGAHKSWLDRAGLQLTSSR